MTAPPAACSLDGNLLVGRDHVVLELPASALAQLGHNHIAVTKQIDIEVVVVYRRPGDVDLGDVRGQEGDELRDGGNLEAGADDDDQVRLEAVGPSKPTAELVRKRLAKEGNVGLHDAALGGHVVLRVRSAVVVAARTAVLLACAIGRELALAAVMGTAPWHGALGAVGDAT